MSLNRTNILASTQYGLQIYAYVLRQFYPNLSQRRQGDASLPYPNPFNHGRNTLIIEVKDQLAVHRDLELGHFKGDVFDFANLWFKMGTFEELYYMLNQVLHLGLKPKAEALLSWLNLEDDSWRPQLSFFAPPIRNVLPTDCLSLAAVRDLIMGSKYRSITDKLRQLKEPKQLRAYKAQYFPYVTFAGSFRKRSDRDLVKSSELLVFDFDHLEDLPLVKQQLRSDPYFDTELLFVSPSGHGLKWIIRHCDPSTPGHSAFFRAVSAYLKQTYSLEADPSGKDLSRACFLCADPDVYLHPRHTTLKI